VQSPRDLIDGLFGSPGREMHRALNSKTTASVEPL
jgi:hypothetical protein